MTQEFELYNGIMVICKQSANAMLGLLNSQPVNFRNTSCLLQFVSDNFVVKCHIVILK